MVRNIPRDDLRKVTQKKGQTIVEELAQVILPLALGHLIITNCIQVVAYYMSGML